RIEGHHFSRFEALALPKSKQARRRDHGGIIGAVAEFREEGWNLKADGLPLPIKPSAKPGVRGNPAHDGERLAMMGSAGERHLGEQGIHDRFLNGGAEIGKAALEMA